MNIRLVFSIIALVLLMALTSAAFGQIASEKAILMATSDIAASLEKIAGVDRIAILTLKKDVDNEVTDRLITAVVSNGKYQVIDRRQLEVIFREQNFQMSDVVDPDTAKQAGKIAGVDAVMYGSIKRQSIQNNRAEIAMHVQMTKVQDGQIVYSKDVLGEHSPEPISLPNWLVPVVVAAIVILAMIVTTSAFMKRRRPKVPVIEKTVVVTPPGATPEPKPGEHQTVTDIVGLLSADQAHSVSCKLNFRTGKATIGRMQLRLKGTKAVPGGWRGKISIASGIDRRYTLIDTINIPRIEPGAAAAIGPVDAEIPRDLERSKDEWSLEFYISDPYGGEAMIFKSPGVSSI